MINYAVFTYGTLQIPAVMAAVTGKTHDYSVAVLPDYGCYQVKRQVFPGMIAKPGESASGVLYHEVDATALELLDAFEADFYHRKKVDVDIGGKHCAAEAYIVSQQYCKLLEKTPWSLEKFRKYHLQEYLLSCRQFHESLTGTSKRSVCKSH